MNSLSGVICSLMAASSCPNAAEWPKSVEIVTGIPDDGRGAWSLPTPCNPICKLPSRSPAVVEPAKPIRNKPSPRLVDRLDGRLQGNVEDRR